MPSLATEGREGLSVKEGGLGKPTGGGFGGDSFGRDNSNLPQHLAVNENPVSIGHAIHSLLESFCSTESERILAVSARRISGSMAVRKGTLTPVLLL
jgi:hypothetical protein